MPIVNISILKNRINTQVTANGVRANEGGNLNSILIDTIDTLVSFVNGSGNSLEDVLAIGNITGPHDIVISGSQVIRSGNGGGELSLDAYGSPSTILLSTDNGQFNNESQLYMERTYVELSSYDINTRIGIYTNTKGITLYEQGFSTPILALYSSDGDILIRTNSTNYNNDINLRSVRDITINTVRKIQIGIEANFSGDEILIGNNSSNSISTNSSNKKAVIIGSGNSTINAGVINSVIIASSGITATKSNTLYTRDLDLENIFLNSGSINDVHYINFITNIPTPPHAEGKVYWLDDTKTISVQTDVNNFSIELGHQTIIRVRNQTGSFINKGKVVYISGGNGNRPLISLADNSNKSTSSTTIGLTATDIANNDNGYVITEGILRGVNTASYTPGTILYLSTNGDITNTPTVSPAYLVSLGKVVYQHATDGIIHVEIKSGYDLEELTDVLITSVANGDGLIRENGLWINKPIANNILHTWTPTSTFTEGQKFIWQAATNDWRTYVVRNGFTLNAGETPFTNPEKVDKINPFNTFSLQYMTTHSGGGVNANGFLGLQNWLYDGINDKYVIAGGSTSDNVLIFTRPNANEIYSTITNINCGHDVMRVVYINNEYWAINDNVAGTLTITRINAVTNTIIETFTSTYSGTISGGYIVRDNKLYYATAQSTVSFFRLYEINPITFTTTLLINQTTSSGFTYMVWWFDEVNGFICTSTNAGNSFRVYNINTYTLIGTYNVPILTSNANINSPIYASDGKTYVLLGQNVTGMGVFEINPSNGSPTLKFRIGNVMPTPNNAWQVLYDSSNPDWALFVSNNNILGVAHFVNVLTGESVPINIPNTTLSQFRYFNKQLEYYFYIGSSGAGTVRQIFRYDFR
jgi:hypothetical protein